MIIPFKNFLKQIFKNQLVAGSAVLFVGSGLASFGNYLYHLLMGRMLGPIDYGVLSSLISLTYLFSVPLGALSLVIVKYVSAWRGKKQLTAVASFYYWLNKKLVVLGFGGFILLMAILPWLVSFLHLDSIWPMLLIIVSTLVGVYSTVNSAVLQAFLRFTVMSGLGIVSVVLKLAVAVGLVFWGWEVLGAVAAILISSLVGWFLGGFWVWRLLGKPTQKVLILNGREMAGYALPVFFSTLAFVSLYTTDIVLVRHFLTAEQAGFYAALATLGKIIVFASGPIGTVMFPMVSEKHANGGQYLGLLTLSLGLVVFICLGISSLYYFFPKLMIGLLFGSRYLPAAPYLFLFAVFLSFYALCFLLMNFYLSVKRVKVVVLPVIAAAAQAILITVFHQSLSQVVWVSVSILGLLTVSLLLYFFLSYAQDKKALAFRHCSRL